MSTFATHASVEKKAQRAMGHRQARARRFRRRSASSPAHRATRADLEVNRVSADVVSLITVRARSLEAEHTLTCDFEALVMHPLRANGVTRS